MPYILDTNIWSKWAEEQEPLVSRIESKGDQGVVITVITACEAFYGWGKAARNRPKTRWIETYREMMQEIEFMRDATVLPFTSRSLEIYDQLCIDYRNPGKADLRIAAIAIEHEFTLVTHNTRDFERINNLDIEDWVRDEPI